MKHALQIALATFLCVTLAVLDRGAHGSGLREGPHTPPYYAAQPWGDAFWAEHFRAESGVEYDPFVLWRTSEFSGEYVNVDSSGRRSTHDAGECTITVSVVGGSSVWGWGVPDWGTIPWQV